LGNTIKALAIILCSSGTTGASKGVCLSHAHILSYLKMFDQPESFRNLSFSPIFWSTGLVSTIITAFRSKDTRIITAQPFSVELLVQIMKKHDVNFFQAAPYQLTLLLQSPLLDPRDFVGVKVFCVLGSIVSEHLRKEFHATFPRHPLLIAYGMSESCISIAATGPTDDIGGLTVGKISPNIYVKVVDDEGVPVDIGKRGEILAKPEFDFIVSEGNAVTAREWK
jgi:4-coumarate--CoA ligase